MRTRYLRFITKKKWQASFPVWLIIFSLAQPSIASAQNLDAVEKLKRQLATANDRQRFDLLSAIGFEYRYSFPDSTLLYCQRAFELGNSIGMTSELSKPLSFIGLAYANKGDYTNSFRYHRESIDLAIKQGDSVELAYGYNNLGRMFFDQGDLVRAFDNLIRSQEIFEKMGDKSGLAYVNRSIASVYATQRDFGKAIEMSHTAYRLRAEIGEPRMIVSSLMELGLVYHAAGDLPSAQNFFLKADSASAQVNDPVTRAELSMGLAEILLEEGNLEEAYARAQKVLAIITEQTNQKMFLRATFLRAKYFFQKKKYQEAVALLRTTLESAENSGNVLFQRDASWLLSEVYRLERDNHRQEEYLNRYKIFSGMLENTDLARQIDRLQFQVEIEKKDKEFEQLKLKNLKDTALIARQEFQNVMLIVVSISVATIAAIIWFNSRRRRLTNHKLALQNQHIVNQREAISRQNEDLSRSNHILSDLNQEKNTLMNIVAHDLKSPLNRISGLASVLELEPLQPEQKEYIRLIRESTRSGLDLITDLLDVNALEQSSQGPDRKNIDIDQLLIERVNSMKMAAETKGIHLEFETRVGRQIVTDPNYIHRIVDNLLSNAIKFSKAGSTVFVSSKIEDSRLVLSVKDTGPGFAEEDRRFLFQKFKKLSARPTGGESSNGLGLAIVKTLVDRLQGQIQLYTERGKGSEFIITLPL